MYYVEKLKQLRVEMGLWSFSFQFLPSNDWWRIGAVGVNK